MERPPTKGKNSEQIRLTFLEAINNTKITEIETEFDNKSVDSLLIELNNSKLFLLGETHGVKENPKIIYTLFKKFGFKNLALEWDIKLSPEVQNFLQTGEIDFRTIIDSSDGRITAGHFALLKKLKEEGLLEKVICFDDWSEENKRDINMAKNILKNLSETPTLIVAGKLHTQTQSIFFEDESEEYHPMGENIKIQMPNTPSGEVEYLSGQYYNSTAKEFRNKNTTVQLTKAKFHKLFNNKYIFELPEAHVAIVPNSL